MWHDHVVGRPAYKHLPRAELARAIAIDNRMGTGERRSLRTALGRRQPGGTNANRGSPDRMVRFPVRTPFAIPQPFCFACRSYRTMPTTCALCRRVIPAERIEDPQVVQEHHLRPEERATSPTVMLCRPCHDQINATFTNDELRGDYDTIEALRHADELDDYIAWIRGTDKLDIQVTTSPRKRDRRG